MCNVHNVMKRVEVTHQNQESISQAISQSSIEYLQWIKIKTETEDSAEFRIDFSVVEQVVEELFLLQECQ